MSTERAHELKAMIDRLEKVIATFTGARHRLVERRRGAADHIMVELDQRLAVNQRTLECLERTVDVARRELKQMDADSYR
jgi:hypothetical protein